VPEAGLSNAEDAYYHSGGLPYILCVMYVYVFMYATGGRNRSVLYYPTVAGRKHSCFYLHIKHVRGNKEANFSLSYT
jgi:hypothetical protein